ncbi:MAG TPA: hypothetical protein ENF23_04035 [Methanosarcinales archaeon]|nr:hypothetical protein [Methanosarcinales archaeon]
MASAALCCFPIPFQKIIKSLRKKNGPRIEWKYKSQEIAAAERSHGKYLLFSTDESLSPDEVVKAYFEKDFVEIGLPNTEDFR